MKKDREKEKKPTKQKKPKIKEEKTSNPIRPLYMGGCAGGAGVPVVSGEVLLFLNNVRNASLGNIQSLAESGVLPPASVFSLLSVALHSRK